MKLTSPISLLRHTRQNSAGKALLVATALAAITLTGCNKPNSNDSAPDTKPAQVASLQAAVDIASYKLRPTDTNKDEAKAALKAMDAEITALKTRAASLASGEPRTATEARIARLEERKKELEHEFNKARFDALIDDVKNEWTKLTS